MLTDFFCDTWGVAGCPRRGGSVRLRSGLERGGDFPLLDSLYDIATKTDLVCFTFPMYCLLFVSALIVLEKRKT